MRRGDKLKIEIVGIDYPNKPYGLLENKKVFVKTNSVIGQRIEGTISRIKKDKIDLRNVEILKLAENEVKPKCDKFNICGGCTYQNLKYEDQLTLKKEQIKKIISAVISNEYIFEDIISSPVEFEYRNKMEFTFGNFTKEGELTLGLHRKGFFHDIVDASNCILMDQNFRLILQKTLKYFQKLNLPFYHKISHEGFLRNLVIRKGENTSSILINLVTSSQYNIDLSSWVNKLLNLQLSSNIIGILHTINDNIADTVNSENETILFGQRDIEEEVLGLKFLISPYSFFQTNSIGIEFLYKKVQEYVEEATSNNGEVIFDLFSGTGTIGQILSKDDNHVYGIEIVEEAVIKANENAKLNGLENCHFIAGDVFDKLDDFREKEINPDLIVIDPPRPGVGEKTLNKILNYNIEKIIYVSCNPKTFALDLKIMQENGYRLSKVCCVDMFPQTPHVELVTLIEKI